MDNARGQFVAICDSNDVSLPDRFETQVRLLSDAPGCDVVSCSRVICVTPMQGRAFAADAPSSHAQIVASLERGRMPILFATAMVRRNLFDGAGRFDRELHRNQDFGFFMRVARSARFATIPRSLILYRTHGRATKWSLVSENNLYRQLARLRHAGADITADRYRRSLVGRLFMFVVIPLQYGWHVLKRGVLGIGVGSPTASERELLSATVRRLSHSGPD